MKKLPLLILMLIFCGFGAMAQRISATPESQATSRTEKMDKKMNFTSEQKAKVQAINLEASQKLEVVRKEVQAGTINQVTAKERRQAINQERNSKITAILTPEQTAKMNKRKEK